jgi:hypothetical protein
MRMLLAPLLLTAAVAQAGPDLRTVAEQSGFARTGRYDEVVALCAAFQAAYPRAVKCERFGTSPEGRPMLTVTASTSGALTPQAAQARHLPVTLVQGGIHAGEIDGKDAGWLALRELLAQAHGPLERQVLVFVPVFNVDGHENFAAWNRPNQRGPAEMGWRTTAQNYNLNRDYVKADTPEMAAMLALVNRWDPLVSVDLHVTDGAKYQHDVAIQAQPVNSGDEGLRAAGLTLRTGVIDAISGQGSLPTSFYTSFAQDDDPASGFVDTAYEPRFSTGYFPLRNRVAMLVETHSWKDYATRVRVTRNTIRAVLDQVAAEGPRWQRLAAEADARAVRLSGPVALTYKATDQARMIDFLGYAYTRTVSGVSGALMTHYDEGVPQTWRVPLRDHIVPDLQVTAPGAGYLVPAAFAPLVGGKLALHGIAFRKLDHDLGKLDVGSFRARKVTLGTASFEGHQRAALDGAWGHELRSVGKGALFVPLAQPKARLVMALLEPQAPDSLAAWGFFNNAWEHKEYMEDYVAEEVARAQLAAEPGLAAEFQERLRSDPAFARSAHARLEFFARRHSSWDERYQLYPVLRLDVAP